MGLNQRQLDELLGDSYPGYTDSCDLGGEYYETFGNLNWSEHKTPRKKPKTFEEGVKRYLELPD